MKKKSLLFVLVLLVISSVNGAVTLLMPDLSGQAGTQITVPIKVTNFQNILSVQGTIQFDTAIVTYVSVQQFGLPGMSGTDFGTTGTPGGKLTFSWYDGTLSGVSVGDSSVIFSITFTIIGTNPQVSPMSFVNTPTQIETVDITFNTVPTTTVDGSVTVESISAGVNNKTSNTSLEIFPNPGNGLFNLKYYNEAGNKFIVKIMNTNGEVLFMKEYSNAVYSNLISVDLSKFADGIYMVEVNDKDRTVKSRLVINN